jgi:hypothetical protein
MPMGDGRRSEYCAEMLSEHGCGPETDPCATLFEKPSAQCSHGHGKRTQERLGCIPRKPDLKGIIDRARYFETETAHASTLQR